MTRNTLMIHGWHAPTFLPFEKKPHLGGLCGIARGHQWWGFQQHLRSGALPRRTVPVTQLDRWTGGSEDFWSLGISGLRSFLKWGSSFSIFAFRRVEGLFGELFGKFLALRSLNDVTQSDGKVAWWWLEPQVVKHEMIEAESCSLENKDH